MKDNNFLWSNYYYFYYSQIENVAAGTYRKEIVPSAAVTEKSEKRVSTVSQTVDRASSPQRLDRLVSPQRVDRASSPQRLDRLVSPQRVDRASSPGPPTTRQIYNTVERPANGTQNASKIDTEGAIKTTSKVVKRKKVVKPTRFPSPKLPHVVYKEAVKSAVTSVKNKNARPSGSTGANYSSLLLEYVCDQTKLLRDDLKQQLTQPRPNKQSCEQLQQLLERQEQLCQQLHEKLEQRKLHKRTSSSDNEQIKSLLDAVCDVRKERERILREIQLTLPEAQPVEIWITVQGAQPLDAVPIRKSRSTHKVVATLLPSPSTRKLARKNLTRRKPTMSALPQPAKSPSREPAQSTESSPTPPSVKSPTPPQEKSPMPPPAKAPTPPALQQKTKSPPPAPAPSQPCPNRVNGVDYGEESSYDSTSTHYRSLPPKLHVTVPLPANLEVPIEQRQGLHPQVAHYVQRLLHMRRSSVRALGVSSSDVESPSSSLIASESNQLLIGEEMQARTQLERVEHFIKSNYSFISELERSVLTQKNKTLERSMQLFDDMLEQHLQQAKSKRQKRPTKTVVEKPTSSRTVVKNGHKTSNKVVQQVPEEPKGSSVKPTGTEAKKSSKVTKEVATTSKSAKVTTKYQAADGVVRRKVEASFQSATEERVGHFTELAAHCTQRINDLNDMLAQVREEKLRLLESTYSSVSLHSPETTPIVGPPPPSPISAASRQSGWSSGEEGTQARDLSSSVTAAAPLEKHTAIGASRDSGISESRPLTALDQRPADGDEEPISSSISLTVRHPKPPPALRRFSPQLEEELEAHELSTIVEVETPATSRRNTSVQTIAQEGSAPVPFPAFEQYVQGLQLDLWRLDPELSLQLEEEFNELVTNLWSYDSQGVPRYTEFPSLTTYLQHTTQVDASLNGCDTTQRQMDAQRVEELITCLRLANLTVRSFPSQREYAKRLHQNSPVTEMLDTLSLENLSAGTRVSVESGSETLNIEQELRQHRQLKISFHEDAKSAEYVETTLVTSHTNSEGGASQPPRISRQASPADAAEQLGTGAWANTMRRRMHETDALSSSSTSTPLTPGMSANAKQLNLSTSSAPSVGDETVSSGLGREMNLRDFLTRELGRYCNTTSGSASTPSSNEDCALRQQFFQSILESLSPSGRTQLQTQTQTRNSPRQSGPAARGSTRSESLSIDYSRTNTLARQKTSTPVASHTSNSRSTSMTSGTSSNTQLFSCESHVSLVPPAERRTRKKH